LTGSQVDRADRAHAPGVADVVALCPAALGDDVGGAGQERLRCRDGGGHVGPFEVAAARRAATAPPPGDSQTDADCAPSEHGRLTPPPPVAYRSWIVLCRPPSPRHSGHLFGAGTSVTLGFISR